MKINIIIPFIYRVGGIKLIFEYANRLTDLGHDVLIYAPIYPYNTKKGEFDLIFVLKRYYRLLKQLISQKENIKKFKELKFTIKQVPFISELFIRDADIIIATAWTTAYSIDKMSAKKGVKYYFVQDYENWESNPKYVDRSYKLNMRIITTCKYLSNLLFQKFNVKSTIIFNGIDMNLFFKEGPDREKVRNILFIDSGMPRKNSQLAIDTILRIKEKYNDITFEAFGHRQFHNMPDYIKFNENPSDEQIRKLYSNADIFLCTSLEEGFATPPAEAMACKCAVVTNIVGAVEEYSTHMQSAMHVNPGDTNAFYEAIIYLIDNPEKWKEICNNAYIDAKKYLDCWDKSTKTLEKIFKDELKK